MGIRVSGFEVCGLLDSTTAGPAILSGGEFGAEASIVALLAALAMAGYFTRKAIDQGKRRAPVWRRGEVTTSGGPGC
ncbi:hypothetical protein [Thermomonas sp.]|uniref:hypothetical protein n=1 Tax=Thermomonas sp. TaxID=1971895 RepID=UPI002489903A|nr:hypothetical protein [Thermomonas sp.]MDI1253962.1 hypothetical protein [Thermomonas sp.]